MKSPRFIRPHKITLFINLGENEEGKQAYKKVVFNRVRFNRKSSVIEDDTGRRNASQAICTIDMNDLHAIYKEKRVSYIDKHVYDLSCDKDCYFTFHEKLDFIIEGETNEVDFREIKKKHKTFSIQEIHAQRSTGNEVEFINLRCYE